MQTTADTDPSRAFETWCAAEGRDAFDLFVRINHLTSAQDKLRAVWEQFDLVKRGFMLTSND